LATQHLLPANTIITISGYNGNNKYR
jgi:hypothetical protein